MARGLFAALTVGAAVGFGLERAVVRRCLVPRADLDDSVRSGWIDGEVSTIRGPDGAEIVVESYGPRAGGPHAGGPREGGPHAGGQPEGGPRAHPVPQLVLSHGWLCTGQVWQRQVAALRDRVRVITYDQPAHGRSTGPVDRELSLDVLGDALMTVVRQATDPGPIVLGGHSLGGMAILNAFRRHGPELEQRVAGVVLISTTSTATGAPGVFEMGIRRMARLERPLRRVTPWLRRPWSLRVLDRVTGTPSDLMFLIARGSQGRAFDPRIAANGLAMFYENSSDAVFAWLDTLMTLDEDAGLDIAARHPLTLVVGTNDRLTPHLLTRRMADRCDAELVELPGVGHVTLLEASDVVNDVFSRHLGIQPVGGHGEVA